MTFYKGNLSPFLKVMVVLNDFLSIILSGSDSIKEMKCHINDGYEGLTSNSVHNYDKYGLTHYNSIANLIIKDIVIITASQFKHTL